MLNKLQWYALIALKWAIGVGIVLLGTKMIYSQDWSFAIQIALEIVLLGLASVLFMGPISYKGYTLLGRMAKLRAKDEIARGSTEHANAGSPEDETK